MNCNCLGLDGYKSIQKRQEGWLQENRIRSGAEAGGVQGILKGLGLH